MSIAHRLELRVYDRTIRQARRDREIGEFEQVHQRLHAAVDVSDLPFDAIELELHALAVGVLLGGLRRIVGCMAHCPQLLTRSAALVS